MIASQNNELKAMARTTRAREPAFLWPSCRLCHCHAMTHEHEALAVFLGDWSAEGTAYGADAEGGPWRSVHSARWHSGGFFIVQDERANGPFDTMSFLGWDQERGTYFCWNIENHGFSREYHLDVDGDEWRFTGATERATITFSEEGRVQTHHWELKSDDDWATLCERVATRVD